MLFWRFSSHEKQGWNKTEWIWSTTARKADVKAQCYTQNKAMQDYKETMQVNRIFKSFYFSVLHHDLKKIYESASKKGRKILENCLVWKLQFSVFTITNDWNESHFYDQQLFVPGYANIKTYHEL